jgi:hypothetical protein
MCPKNVPNWGQKNHQKVIHFQTAHKTGEMSKMGSKTTRKTGHSKIQLDKKKKKIVKKEFFTVVLA